MKTVFPMLFQFSFSLGYVWFLENLRENVKKRKWKGKVKKKLKSINYFYILLQFHSTYFVFFKV